MGFEKIKRKKGGSRTTPMISLRKTGSIGINQAALDEFFAEDDSHVELYFDDTNNQLGLHRLKEETKDSYTLTRSDSGGAVTPVSFLNEYELVPDDTQQYEPDTYEYDGVELVVIEVGDPDNTYGIQGDEDGDEDEEGSETANSSDE
jgi:hypothetical protein